MNDGRIPDAMQHQEQEQQRTKAAGPGGEGGKEPPSEAARASDLRTEAAAAVLLGVATLATTWCGYRSTRCDDDQMDIAGRTAALRLRAYRAEARAARLAHVDAALFVQWLNATAEGDARRAEFYRARFRPESAPAFEAWRRRVTAAKSGAPPAPPASPFEMPEYRPSALREAESLREEAERAATEGAAAGTRGMYFARVSLILAVVLFFGGVAPQFGHARVRNALLGIAAALLAFGLWLTVVG